MSHERRGGLAATPDPSTTKVTTTTLTDRVTAGATVADIRRWRIRRWAARQLDAMLAEPIEPVNPWDYSTPAGEIDYHRCHLDCSYGERDKIGADMAAVRWVP